MIKTEPDLRKQQAEKDTQVSEPSPQTARDNFLAGHLSPIPKMPEKLLRIGASADTMFVTVESPGHGRINELAPGSDKRGPSPAAQTFVDKLRSEIANLPDDRDVIINLAGLHYLASSAIVAFEYLESRLSGKGKRMAFCGLNTTNHDIFQTTWRGGFQYTNHPDEASALTDLQRYT